MLAAEEHLRPRSGPRDGSFLFLRGSGFDGLVRTAPYFRGGVTPAGSGTCPTFSVIDTRL